MEVEVRAVDFKVQPIVAEGLREAEHGFAVVRINAVDGGLIEQSHDCVAENQRDEGVHALGSVLDVDRRVELEGPLHPFPCFGSDFVGEGERQKVECITANVDEHGYPDERQLLRIRDVDARNPNRGADEDDAHVEYHDVADHWDQVRDEDQVGAIE